jgi:hypothetical protein
MSFLGGFILAWVMVAFVTIANAWHQHKQSRKGIGTPMLWQIGQFNNKNRNHQRKENQ